MLNKFEKLLSRIRNMSERLEVSLLKSVEILLKKKKTLKFRGIILFLFIDFWKLKLHDLLNVND